MEFGLLDGMKDVLAMGRIQSILIPSSQSWLLHAFGACGRAISGFPGAIARWMDGGSGQLHSAPP